MKVAMRPSAVSRPSRLTETPLLRSRRIWIAFSMSPLASLRAALQSIIGRLVRSRSCITSLALIWLIFTSLQRIRAQTTEDGGQKTAVCPLSSVFCPLFTDAAAGLGVRRGPDVAGRRRGARPDHGLLFRRQGGPAFEHGIRQPAQHQLDRTDAVVIAGNG